MITPGAAPVAAPLFFPCRYCGALYWPGGDCATCITLAEFRDAEDPPPAPPPGRAVPPYSRWWCAPAVDLTFDRIPGRRTCGTCFSSAAGDGYFCRSCLRRQGAALRLPSSTFPPDLLDLLERTPGGDRLATDAEFTDK